MATSAHTGIFGLCVLLALLPFGTYAGRTQTEPFEQGRLARVKALDSPVILGDVPVYYTPGYAMRARNLQDFVRDELRFYQSTLKVKLKLTIAVLDKYQWSRAEQDLPYPMPSVSGDATPVALLAADWSQAPNFLAQRSDANSALLKTVAARKLAWDVAAAQAADLIGGHELGHTVIDAYGIVPGTHWLNEFLASYALYAYLAEKHPDKIWLLDLLETTNGHAQHHVSLDDFESGYARILSTDGANYAWYQGQFLALVRRMRARQGMRLFPRMREEFPGGGYAVSALGNAETLRRLDAIDPLFRSWSGTMALKQRSVATLSRPLRPSP